MGVVKKINESLGNLPNRIEAPPSEMVNPPKFMRMFPAPSNYSSYNLFNQKCSIEEKKEGKNLR